MNQTQIIRDCLHHFCRASGLNISLSKTKLYVSRNVNINRALELSSSLGVSLTGDLGKYLGIPLLHKKTNNRTFSGIIDNINRRLSGWKGRFLNLAGRTVLIKSVLSSLPNYYMQTMLLPIGVTKDIDRKCRGFLWNSSEDGKKPHLISWDEITKDKDVGGLGIKKSRSHNIAFIMKLCWGLITKKDSLWVKVLRDKYNCGNITIPMIVRDQNCSYTWRSICKVWETFLEGIGWKLGRGDSVSFWFDKWAPPTIPLIHYCTKPDWSLHERVCDFVNGNGTWNLYKLKQVLPPDIIDQIKLIKTPIENGVDDYVYWRSSGDGNFSVKAAYQDIESNKDDTMNRLWSDI